MRDNNVRYFGQTMKDELPRVLEFGGLPPFTVVRLRDLACLFAEKGGREQYPLEEALDMLLRELRLKDKRGDKGRAKELLKVAECFGWVRTSREEKIVRILPPSSELEWLCHDFSACLENYDQDWSATKIRFAQFGRDLHRYFLERLRQYAFFYDFLCSYHTAKKEGVTATQIRDSSVNKITKVVAENLSRCGEMFGSITWNRFYWLEREWSRIKRTEQLYTQERFYPIQSDTLEQRMFREVATASYYQIKGMLSTTVQAYPGFISIPLLREYTCERLAIHREDFDEYLRGWCMSEAGSITLHRVRELQDECVPAIEAQLDKKGQAGFYLKPSDRKQVLRPLSVSGERFYYLSINL